MPETATKDKKPTTPAPTRVQFPLDDAAIAKLDALAAKFKWTRTASCQAVVEMVLSKDADTVLADMKNHIFGA